MSQTFLYITLALYGCATLLYLAYLARTTPLLASWSHRLITLGFISHLLSTIHLISDIGHLPINTIQESLSLFSLTIVGAFILFERFYRVAILGSFITPLAMVLIAVSSVIPDKAADFSQQSYGLWFWIHIMCAFISHATFSISAAVSVMYLLQQHFLKKKHFGALFRKLPSLEMLDDISYRSLMIGFPLLTVAIISGVVRSYQAVGIYWSWSDPKQVWTLVTWLIYAALLHGRVMTGWRGKRAAYLSVTGFIVLLISLVGIRHNLNW
jgi:cytochrome c-type biogenesis protein CcsB